MESKTESVRNFNHNSLPSVWKTGAVRKSSEDMIGLFRSAEVMLSG
ncbi:hypothetical protein CLOLEP_02829 [[Clostridium] leptum DSM 753]|uniref:Uncharacterized protein n=1 Tax=[Clostridium] leptum DSM 753 TaxID=428125 RepID=A7VW65_9FIRM|nr:hypothetical protein CLOLEP_02829 [[Clostridium] leptum DSM 753]MCC3319138.1 hypothetical protein [[Clostridium] innocuum]